MKNWKYALGGIIVFLLVAKPINNQIRKKRVSIINVGNYTLGNFYEYHPQVRRRFYTYKFNIENLEYHRDFDTNEKFTFGSSYLVIYNPDNPSESYILTDIKVPDSLLGKKRSWINPPTWTSKEKVLKNLEDY